MFKSIRTCSKLHLIVATSTALRIFRTYFTPVKNTLQFFTKCIVTFIFKTVVWQRNLSQNLNSTLRHLKKETWNDSYWRNKWLRSLSCDVWECPLVACFCLTTLPNTKRKHFLWGNNRYWRQWDKNGLRHKHIIFYHIYNLYTIKHLLS